MPSIDPKFPALLMGLYRVNPVAYFRMWARRAMLFIGRDYWLACKVYATFQQYFDELFYDLLEASGRRFGAMNALFPVHLSMLRRRRVIVMHMMRRLVRRTLLDRIRERFT